ncbi:MAG: DUF4402 domain-containing protein [Alphaproteobacteria bacterium]|nr:DUF4402 domain-containing protein [Alphaproteobacteria bacterium]
MSKISKNIRISKKAAASAAVMVMLSALPARYAAAETAPLTVEALIAPTGQAIVATQNLDFGSIVQPGGAGTVTVNTAGAPTYGPGMTPAGAAPSEGIIKAFGTTGVLVEYSLPANATINSGANSMTVDQFNIGTPAGGLTYSAVMPGTTVNIPVGGRLNVNPGQATGTYTGTVTVNATFN